MHFYNTKTKKLEKFTPINQYEVLLYTCGPTVYNYLHVGNWVAYIRWDILVRTLLADGYDVKRVMNITDVGHLVSDADYGEDKMEKSARREGKTAWEIAKMYTEDFMLGLAKLNLIEPTYITKATGYIPQQIDLIKKLDEKGYTYVIDDGVYFDTSRFPTYADFANLRLDELKDGARVEQNVQKRNPSDFALWKFSPKNETRDMEWDSPWGKGFPGWHLECSAMAITKLGPTIDIHTGGIDHIPVHHTNEIAQSEAATGKTFVNYWLHNNFLLVDGTKVSKSIGNTYTLQDLSDKGFSPEDFKMFVLQSHYRTESNFTWENLQAAQNRLNNWKKIACLQWQAHELAEDCDDNCVTDENLAYLNSIASIKVALNNDLDTPNALVALEEGLNWAEVNGVHISGLSNFHKLLDTVETTLGLKISGQDITIEQKQIINDRLQARNNQNWSLSDELRAKLKEQGIEVKDSKSGQSWYKVT